MIRYAFNQFFCLWGADADFTLEWFGVSKHIRHRGQAMYQNRKEIDVRNDPGIVIMEHGLVAADGIDLVH